MSCAICGRSGGNRIKFNAFRNWIDRAISLGATLRMKEGAYNTLHPRCLEKLSAWIRWKDGNKG